MSVSNIDEQLASIDKLLNELTDQEVDDLNFDFDPENVLVAASERALDDPSRRRMFKKGECVDKLETEVSDHKQKMANIGGGRGGELIDVIEDAQEDIKRIDIELTKEEESLFEGITDAELVEFAAMASLHGLVTQEVSTFVDSMKPVPKEINLRVSKKEPTPGPRRPHLHLDDEDIDLDVPLLMKCLEEDGDKIYFVKIHNITLEKYILYGIFDKLKTTKSLKHLALTNVGLNDEKLMTLTKILKENKTIETLNLESNIFTNHACELLLEMLIEHPSIREVKLSHQKFQLGTRGEVMMTKLMETNRRMMKIGYAFTIAACRSAVDRAMVTNQEAERQKRACGEAYYNYPEEIKRRNAHPQPWIRTQEARTEKMKVKIAQQKVRMKCIPNIAMMRALARIRAKNESVKF